MKPLTSTISFAATLTLANAALAQHTRIICEASGDYGLTWHDLLTVWPGQRVDVRVRIQLVNPFNHPVQGLSGATYQPVLTGWQPQLGDSVVPFGFPGRDRTDAPTTETAYDGVHVRDTIGAVGRLFPFGANRQGQTSAAGLLSAFTDPGNVLRFAGSRNTTMTTNVAWGVATAQEPRGLAGSFFSSNVDAVVFRYAVKIGTTRSSTRTLVAYVPFESVAGPLAKYYWCDPCASIWNLPILSTSILAANIAVRHRCYADLVGNLQPNPADPTEPPRRLPDGSVTIDDLLYFLEQFELGTSLADLNNGSIDAIPDGAVTIDDLLFFIAHFESGC